ncbi:3',5'-cyclic adenosine monophosphate phosphodiesterase CpdA [Chlamydia avium]|uniref:Calcineurin-like phosphoesterase family protein n=2 Tax=Chlamydia avium TaxID=1457141 RepID=W8JG23_9CHLA|nr:metallophosphoesterase [Chlamydia avium]AHK63501.1 Calcineurin-like phosphoesterase family protein [Chlamydia avium 10DC88]EPP37033.1 calcineurin-like phosphoesterase family protein [Chlamydia psittaci 10_743_SC13]EPP38607.1 calcineurin-like phosphoesterase family protein [Chlamydia avium]VVT43094.1 3',5'-cyclic adenosine monophosphate phosphodiesterase CpdA [Chlamydia avium]
MDNKPPGAHRLLHISDVHFAIFPTNPLTLMNKRFKGMLRQVFGRVNFQSKAIAEGFPTLAKQLQANSICITGDFSLTALNQEFALAKQFVHTLETQASVYVLPGNHDVYTQRSLIQQTFYQYFPNIQLQNEGIAFHKLLDNWWLVLLDCSCLNGWFSANGMIKSSQISILENFILNHSVQENIIIANHYPLLSTSEPSHDLINNTSLQNALKKYSNVHLYLHGHDHQSAMYHNKNYAPHLILNSGSISLPSNASFHIIDLYPQGYRIHTATITNLTSGKPLEISVVATHLG